jgi:protein-S-isoprenylcysteine O-methyltransferase
MQTPHLLLTALVLLWMGSEAVYNQRRSGDRRRAQDRGTLQLLHVAVYGALALALLLAWQGVARFGTAWRMPLLWTGCALMAAGLLLRAWSVRVLAEHFTVDVAIRPGHALIRSGPYRVLRHPSYTGALLTFYGFALALGSVAALGVVAAAVTAAFLWRIRVEEAVLRRAFPDDYADYARRTKRLIPFVW